MVFVELLVFDQLVQGLPESPWQIVRIGQAIALHHALSQRVQHLFVALVFFSSRWRLVSTPFRPGDGNLDVATAIMGCQGLARMGGKDTLCCVPDVLRGTAPMKVVEHHQCWPPQKKLGERVQGRVIHGAFLVGALTNNC